MMPDQNQDNQSVESTPNRQQSFRRLIALIMESPYFKTEHISIIKAVCLKLNLQSSSLQHINKKIQDQIEIEADIIYLLGKYRVEYYETLCLYEEVSGCSLAKVPSATDEGFRRNIKEITALVDSDPDVAVLKNKYLGMKSLYKDLQNIFQIILARNENLNHLSNNYRKELTVDNNSY